MRKKLSRSRRLLRLFTAAAAWSQESTQKPLSPPASAEATLAVRRSPSTTALRRSAIARSWAGTPTEARRTGANAATTLNTETDLTIGSLLVPKGTYTLYTIPGEKEWTLVRQQTDWPVGGTSYDAKQDLGRTKMTVKTIKPTVETFE